MNVTNDGKHFNFALKPLDLISIFGETQFGWQIADSIVEISTFPDWPVLFVGERRSNQKAAA